MYNKNTFDGRKFENYIKYFQAIDLHRPPFSYKYFTDNWFNDIKKDFIICKSSISNSIIDYIQREYNVILIIVKNYIYIYGSEDTIKFAKDFISKQISK
jgi:hypothetical protein